jgi:hypothetical protein
MSTVGEGKMTMPQQQIPNIPEEDFEAPDDVVEPEHPTDVPKPPQAMTQDPEASHDAHR